MYTPLRSPLILTQGWPPHVESDVFVMHLLHHFREINKPASADEWTIQFLSQAYGQSIKEAFDDDDSGLITIAEVNRLVDSLPSALGWRSATYLSPFTKHA